MANSLREIFPLALVSEWGSQMTRRVPTKRRLYVKLNSILRTARAADWSRLAASAAAEIKYRKADSALRYALRIQILEAAE